MLNIFGKEEIKCKFAVRSNNGVVAERLGSGLQNRLPRFESGRCLKTKRATKISCSFLFYILLKPLFLHFQFF